MRRALKLLQYWLPPVFWMTVIFSASCDAQSYQHSSTLVEPLLHWLFPRMPLEQVQLIHHLLRKCAHMMEYALLVWLLWRAVRLSRPYPPRPWNWTEAALALGMVLLYSSTDELHQCFIPGRTGQVSDVAVDVAGAALGLAMLWTYTVMIERFGVKCAVRGIGRESVGC